MDLQKVNNVSNEDMLSILYFKSRLGLGVGLEFREI